MAHVSGVLKARGERDERDDCLALAVESAVCGDWDRGDRVDVWDDVAARSRSFAHGHVSRAAGEDLDRDYGCRCDAVVASGLKSVTRLPDREGLPAHVEDTAAGKLMIQTQSMEPPRKLVNRIGGESLPFGGTWTFEVTPTPDGSTLRITENGYVTNPIFRFVARFVMGYTSEMDKYLTGLAQHFGEKPQIGE